MTDDPDCWIADLEALLGSLDGLREALEVHRRAHARHDSTNAALAAAEAALDLLLVAPDAHPQQLRTASLDVAALRILLDALPPTVGLDPGYAVTVAERIGQWFAQHPARLGAPPLCLAETRHHYEAHRHDPRSPRATDAEVEVLNVFELVAHQVFSMNATVALLTSPLTAGERIEDRARAFLGFVPPWLDHAKLVARTRALVDQVDAERRASSEAHRCPLWGGQLVGPLMDVDVFPGGAWSEVRAMSDGLPATPSLAGVA